MSPNPPITARAVMQVVLQVATALTTAQAHHTFPRRGAQVGQTRLVAAINTAALALAEGGSRTGSMMPRALGASPLKHVTRFDTIKHRERERDGSTWTMVSQGREVLG